MPEIKPNEVYTTQEARDFLKVSESTVKRFLKNGIIKAYKVGGTYRIWGSEILRLVSPEVESKVYKVYDKIRKKLKKPLKNGKSKIVVAVSGGFDPIHVGHARLFKKAKSLGDKLVVILNNDNWLKQKKGFVFVPQNERKEIIESLKWVDEVVVTGHCPNPKDMSVCAELKKIKPNIFANGGDRTKNNIPEVPVCREINCKMVFNAGEGGKIQSSSWLLEKFLKSKKHS